ncbi:MAG TPA: Xaa-Pro peptidase family protein [Anaerolineae bacterium]|nr:Xaa-Pro peptidase family protein [Anaerolineae bacterium]HMR63110.1 Xaa-Pro peptidase family protein [Anaerolineae bacterium]
MDLANIQQAMAREGIEAWVIYDFQSKNPIMRQFVQPKSMTTRRLFLVIPIQGEPQLLGSRVDHDVIDELPFLHNFYVSWQQMEAELARLLEGCQLVAMDYSPGGELPTVSRVDAGTVELIRKLGKTIVSAANVYQAGAAIWEAGTLEAHLEDCERVARIKDEAFAFIAEQLRYGKLVTEYDVQQFIAQQFEQQQLFTPDSPIVGVNAHSGDPHYFPSANHPAPIKKGDWILIDLWAKRPGYKYVMADMTWVAVAGSQPTVKQQQVFNTVAAARDRAIEFLQACVDQGRPVEGWQVDDEARKVITQAGYGDYFIHRTGHSLGPGDHAHGSGANIDNLETHDTRQLIPGIGFSIEPGIYLPEFGVRLEIDVYMSESGPLVTTPIQREIICLETVG